MALSRRTLLRRVGLVAAGGELAACGEGAAAPPPPAPAPAAADKPATGGPAVTLKALYWSAGPEDHQVFVDTFNGFEKLNPSIKIEFDDTPSDQFVQKATTMFAAGLPPDVMKTHAAW